MKSKVFVFLTITIFTSCSNSRKDFYEDGKLKGITYPNGEFITYYNNENKKSEGTIKNDLKEGIYKEYYENGKLKIIEDNYVKGKLTGIHSEFDINGVKIKDVEFENDTQNGSMKEYFQDGQIKSKTLFSAGKKHGEATIYYKNGKEFMSGEFFNDEFVLSIKFDSIGNKIDEFRKVIIIDTKDTLEKHEKYFAKIYLPGPKNEKQKINYHSTLPERKLNYDGEIKMYTLPLVNDTAIYEFTVKGTGTFFYRGYAFLKNDNETENIYEFTHTFFVLTQ